MILCEEMTLLQAQNRPCFQFWSPNVLINCSELLGILRRNKALGYGFP